MHIGEAIRKELERQGKTVVWFAEQLSYTRANIYKIFEKSSIDTELLYRISSVLNLDFFKFYTDRMQKEGN